MPPEVDMGHRILYELETANRALPLVRAIIHDVVADFRVLRNAGRHQRALQAEHDGDAITMNRLSKLRAQIEEVSTRIEGYLRELDDLGIELRDLETGSVDFPTLMHGLPAYLCWRLGEDEVAFWHAANAGFADRQPIPREVGAILRTTT